MLRLVPLFLIACAVHGSGQAVSGHGEGLTAAQAQALVKRALANEYAAVQDASHPMRYQLRKNSPRLTTTKDIAESRDGAVARLVAINDRPLGTADAQKEEARLNGLLADPGRQRRRKQAESEDMGRVLTVLRALPNAFVYQYEGPGESPAGKVEKFAFKPNPRFSPSDLETEALPAITGELWIDGAHERVVRLEGHVQQNVDFGWGVLGRLNKGGWIVIEQAEVCGGQWRTVHFQMAMSGRVLFKTRVFDTTEDQTRWAPLPAGLDYKKAIAMLRGEP